MWKVDGNEFSNSWQVAEYIEENGCMQDMYSDLLDEQYGKINIAGFEYDASYALKNLSENDFNYAFSNWADGVKRDMCSALERMSDGETDTYYGVEIEFVEE